MKLLSILIAGAAASSSGDLFADLFEEFNQEDGFRSIFPALGDQKADGYGCWCHFSSNMIRSGGNPVDALDEQCMRFIKSTKCMEHREAGCVNNDDLAYVAPKGPHKNAITKYKDFTVADSVFQAELEAFCTAQNADPCSRDICVQEWAFKRAFARLNRFEGVKAQGRYLFTRGFDLSTCKEASVTAGSGDPRTGVSSCCGEFPLNMRPVKESKGQACCAGVNIFNNAVSCCDGGVVKDIGDC